MTADQKGSCAWNFLSGHGNGNCFCLPNNRRFSRLAGGRRKQVHRAGDSRAAQIMSTRRNHTNTSSNIQTTDEYKAAVSNAVAFKHENPDEKATTAAQIHHVNAITV